MDWEFFYGPIATLAYIFDGSDTQIIYKDSSLSLLQLKVTKGTYINIMMDSTYDDNYTYVYGFSNARFKKLCKELVNQDIDLKHEAKVFNNQSQHMSTWSTLMLFLEPLLAPEVRWVPSS
jgi:hypothetical protein